MSDNEYWTNYIARQVFICPRPWIGRNLMNTLNGLFDN